VESWLFSTAGTASMEWNHAVLELEEIPRGCLAWWKDQLGFYLSSLSNRLEYDLQRAGAK